MTQKEIFEAAMSLPDESKVALAEELVAYLGTQVESGVEKAHLEVASRRRNEILSGRVQGLEGESVMARAREIVGE